MKNSQNNSGISITLKNPPAARRAGFIPATLSFLSQLAVLFAAAYGAVFCFISMMHPSVNGRLTAIWIGACSFVFMLLFTLVKRRRYIIMLATAAACAIAFFALFSQSVNGLLCLIDSSRSAIASSMNWSVPDAMGTHSGPFQPTLLLFIALPLLIMGLCYFITVRANFFAVFLLTFPFFEVGAAFGCVPDYIAFSLMISCWVGALVLHTSNRARVKVVSKNGGRRRRSSAFLEKKRGGRFAITAAALSLVVFLVFSVSHDLLVDLGYSRTENMDALRRDIRTVYTDLIDRITGEDRDGSLKEGRLYKLGDLKVKNRHYITVQMPNSAEAVYLRGYVGSRYTGSEWADLENYTDYNDMFEEFTSQRLLAGALQGRIIDSSLNNFLFSSGEFHLSEFRRRKPYSYTTYGALLDIDRYTAYFDKSVYAASSAEYSFNAYFELDDLYKIQRQPLYIDPDFRSIWTRYTAFVNSNYLAVPSTVSSSVLDVGRNAEGSSFAKVDVVRDWLAENTQYSTFSKTLPANTDFVSYFVDNQKYGYSAHYASSAAVMLRAAGVPTRYVEGYLLSPDKISNSPNAATDLTKRVDVTDAEAHAWIEIYDNGYGWLPVDVTPGFYTGSFEEYVAQASERSDFEYEDEQEEEETADDVIDTDLEEDNVVPEVEQGGATTPDGDIGVTSVGWQQTPITVIIPILLTLLALILLLPLVLLIRRLIVLRRRRARLHSPDERARVFAAYRYLIALLRFEGVREYNVISYAQFSEHIRQNAELLPLEGLDDALDIILQAAFSDKPINEQQADAAVSYVEGYAFELAEAASLFSRIKFKYFFNLI